MPLEVRADFCLGFFQGRSEAGTLEEVPTPERLHSALLAGACSLERLEGKHPDEGLDSLDAELFGWLEDHAPDAVQLPDTIANESRASAFRNKGEIFKGVVAGNKECVASARSFLNGPVEWYWNEVPGDQLVERLGMVAQEVPYLGESASPVQLEVSVVECVPDRAMKRCAPSFDARAFSAADRGRTDELSRFFALRQTKVKRDKTRTNEEENSLQFNALCVRDVYYAHPESEPAEPDVPWPKGFLVRLEDRSAHSEEFVAWSVMLHRALASKFGDALPRIMQRAGMASMANGLAIQVITSELPCRCTADGDGHDHLLVMLPRGTTESEEFQIANALSRITTLFSNRLDKARVTFTGELVDLAEFWNPAAQGTRRLFSTEPLFIADSRPPSKAKPDGTPWTVDDDARVALGHVWRDRFSVQASGDQGRVELSQTVAQAGVSVGGGRVVPTAAIRDYVHHTNRGTMLVGEKALIDMGSLGHPNCICAIGQTRHLGGGLLVPLDIPDASEISTTASGVHEKANEGDGR
jgi:CRISPR-associated protein Csb2